MMGGIVDFSACKVRYDLHDDIFRMPVDVEKMRRKAQLK